MKNVKNYSILSYGVCTSDDSFLVPPVMSHRVSYLGITIGEAYQDCCSHLAHLGYNISLLPDVEEVEKECLLNPDEREKLNNPKYFAYLTIAVQ